MADKLSGHKSWIQIEIGFLKIFAKKIAGIAWNIGELPKTKMASNFLFFNFQDPKIIALITNET